MVCDKTDNTVKVIKSDNRSSNYVPIKGGFPFRQIAQQWIDDNYTTTTCNPGEIVKQIKAEEDNKTQTEITNGGVTIFNSGCVGESKSIVLQLKGYNDYQLECAFSSLHS